MDEMTKVLIALGVMVGITGAVAAWLPIRDYFKKRALLAAVEIEFGDGATYLVMPGGQRRKIADHKMSEEELDRVQTTARIVFKQEVKRGGQ